MKSSILFLLFVLITLVYSQNDCPGQTSCSNCTAEAGCGWCSATQKCLKGGKNGPDSESGEVCYGSAWLLKCPSCQTYKDCRECSSHSNDCVWKNSQNACIQLTETSGSSDPCTCSEFPDCGECLYQTGCGWCAETSTCFQTSNGTCNMPVHSCDCKEIFSCDRCLETNPCQWCSGGPAINPGCFKIDDGCPNDGLAAHSCQTYCEREGPTCGDCLTAEGCTWCERTTTCIDISRAPAECNGLVTHQCKQCRDHLYCSSCNQQPGCSWCAEPNAPRCVESSGTGCQFTQHSCTSFCADQKDCGTCRSLLGCTWCGKEEKCVDIDSAECLVSTYCEKKGKCGFDASSFVGGMFLIIGLVILITGGYIFYRWKVGLPLLPGTVWQPLE